MTAARAHCVWAAASRQLHDPLDAPICGAIRCQILEP